MDRHLRERSAGRISIGAREAARSEGGRTVINRRDLTYAGAVAAMWWIALGLLAVALK